MKTCFLTIVVMLFFSAAFCQDIDFKKDLVIIGGKECIKMSKEDAVSISFTDMEGNDLIFMRYIHGSKYGSVYNKITFVGQKLSLTSQSYIYTKKNLIKKLVQNKVIQDCKINPENLEKFLLKYDENIEK